MATVHLHIVEEAELRGTKYSCVPRDRPEGLVVATESFFASEEGLVQSVMAAFTAMHAAGAGTARHLLVLSAHGEPRTGTHIEVAQDTHVPLDGHMDIFAIRPTGLVAFVSACWGGYPSAIRALRAEEHTEKPLIVAPLVPVHPSDANELQRRLVDAMIRDDVVDSAVERVTVQADEALAPEYGEPVFRVVRRDGTSVPPEGEAGLAAPLEKSATYLVLAVQRDPAARGEPPGMAMVQGQDGRYWRVPVPVLTDAVAEDAVYALVGTAVRFRAKIHRYADAEALGELVDIAGLEPAGRLPRSLRHHPPYAHATEATIAKADGEAVNVPFNSLRRCKRCNWVSISFRSERHGTVVRHHVSAVCHRNACEEHAKWLPEGPPDS